MAVYNTEINRTDAGALIPEEAAKEIMQVAAEQSYVLRMARRLPNMSRAQKRLPVLSALPSAYFVGERGRTPQTFGSKKQTTEAAWSNKYINAEEIAVLVPIPQNVLDDADFDIWGELKPHIGAAFGKTIDTAILFGESDVTVPVAWPDGLFLGMPNAHKIHLGEIGDLYDDIFGVGGVISKVEEDGYLANGHLAALVMRARLRGLRLDQGGGAGTGAPLFVQDMRSRTPYTLDGLTMEFPKNGAWDPTTYLMLTGDWDQLVWSMRTDITYKLLTEGVITDASTPPQIQYNLGQEDMVALRCTMRLGWQLPNPINPINPTEATRFPFAALTTVSA